MQDYSPLDDAISNKSITDIEDLLRRGHSLRRYNRYNNFGYMAEDPENNEFIIWLLNHGLDIDSLGIVDPDEGGLFSLLIYP